MSIQQREARTLCLFGYAHYTQAASVDALHVILLKHEPIPQFDISVRKFSLHP